jgi:hypothetical protein
MDNIISELGRGNPEPKSRARRAKGDVTRVMSSEADFAWRRPSPLPVAITRRGYPSRLPVAVTRPGYPGEAPSRRGGDLAVE